MTKKSFFREKTLTELRDLRVRQANTERNLVDRIASLDVDSESIELRLRLIPGYFFINADNSAEASRKCLKHGEYLTLSHPKTQSDCNNSREIPLKIRSRDFEKLKELKEEQIDYVGYSVRPTWGDRTRRVVPFTFLPEGVKLFTYAENKAGGIKVSSYDDAKRVQKEGANIVVEVPSRTVGQQRYRFRLNHVPVLRGAENLASVLLLKPSTIHDEATKEPLRGRTPHDTFYMRYTWATDQEGSDVITYYPHDIASYLAIIKEEWTKNKNLTPMEMNPFALPSQHQATFYAKLDNIIVYDPTLSSKHKLRKPHLAEKSILLARAIGKYGHDDFCFWDWERDGALKNYDWSGRS
ncbi:MAG: hypothetical protein Q7S74_04520 [Nanoarchaeota archaeon]|nr:hypothetical protein [Nanoarchaeota archaeon]